MCAPPLCLKEIPCPLDSPSVDPRHVAQEDDWEAHVQEASSQGTHGAASQAFDMGFPSGLPVADILADSYESFASSVNSSSRPLRMVTTNSGLQTQFSRELFFLDLRMRVFWLAKHVLVL